MPEEQEGEGAGTRGMVGNDKRRASAVWSEDKNCSRSARQMAEEERSREGLASAARN